MRTPHRKYRRWRWAGSGSKASRAQSPDRGRIRLRGLRVLRDRGHGSDHRHCQQHRAHGLHHDAFFRYSCTGWKRCGWVAATSSQPSSPSWLRRSWIASRAGVLPGALLAILMMLTVAYFAHRNGWGGDVKFSSTRFFKAMCELAVVIAWPLLMWLLVEIGRASCRERVL